MFAEIHKVIDILNQEGIIVYPTDTVWGIGGDATSSHVIEAIYSLKKRPANKSFIVLLPTAKDILKYVANPHPNIIEIVQSFTRPTTVVYQDVLGFPDSLLAPDGSLGIRVVQDSFCKALLKQWKKPLISTSANISGAPTASFYKEIDPLILAGADYVVQHRRDDTAFVAPSDIVKINADGSILQLR